MQAVFGHGADRQLREMRRRLDALTAWLNDSRNLTMIAALGPRVMSVSRTYRSVMGTVESAVMEEVQRRQAAPSREDIVAMLMEARYEDGEKMLSEGALRDELVTLLTDGPTSTSLAWAFDRLLREPDKLERARADARDGDGAYLDAIVKETLRLRTPIPIVVRRLMAPMEVAGYKLPAGTVVAPCVHLIHRNAGIYPEPERFRPERFLERPAGTYTWIPFGGGVRRCLAASFAELEMRQVLKETLGSVRLRTFDTQSERVRKAAISFSPSRSALVIAE
jgi:cytochrome P450